MPDFDQIHFNTPAFSELTQLLKTQKLPNALLFYGKEHTRKKEAALFLAKGANCLDLQAITPCHQCRSCIKIDQVLHPDIHQVAPAEGKKTISINQIREMAMSVAVKPNEARTRILIISEADLMNTQAQNALLKLLEEPPETTVFVLTAQKESRLLPTILSRCRKIRFQPMTINMLHDHLVNGYDVDPQQALIISQVASGDYQKALTFLNLNPETKETDWIKRRHWIMNDLADLIRSSRYNMSKALAMSQKISALPKLVEDTVLVMKLFFRDLSVFKWTPEKIVNLDFSIVYDDINQQMHPPFFQNCLQEIYETEKRLLSNASLRLTMDRFFLKLGYFKGPNS